MKSIVAAIAAFAVAAVSAQTNIVSITSPLTGNVYTAGQTALITWINPTVTTIPQIELVKGPSTALQPVLTVASNVDAAALQYSWAIPATTAAGTDYAFELGTSPNISYSGFFTIQAATGAAANSTGASSAAASSAPASTSAAAASSSAPATSAMASSAATSAMASSAAASSAAATTKANGAGAIKAGVVGAGLAAGAAVLLL
ncbi:hypothetical protein BGW37DRAFT_509709 [Umbelopsis sp. PMI_123]|nr:hypothetical protein BGW37DRAFT_509709 [Umbelopsis sp. PMI_123]